MQELVKLNDFDASFSQLFYDWRKLILQEVLCTLGCTAVVQLFLHVGIPVVFNLAYLLGNGLLNTLSVN